MQSETDILTEVLASKRMFPSKYTAVKRLHAS